MPKLNMQYGCLLVTYTEMIHTERITCLIRWTNCQTFIKTVRERTVYIPGKSKSR